MSCVTFVTFRTLLSILLPRTSMQRSGIVGIEKELERRRARDAAQIQDSFRDLQPLIESAKEMVALARRISEQIREKKGAISEEETVQFRAHLLSLGIGDPVTRANTSGNDYYFQLAKECCHIMRDQIGRAGGMMSLMDAYVHVNRARGFDLISPEDFRQACQALNEARMAVRLEKFKSGVLVLRNEEFNFEIFDQAILDKIAQQGCSSSAQLSASLSISPILTSERLLLAEERGLLCRDESVEGVKFYCNKFLNNNE